MASIRSVCAVFNDAAETAIGDGKTLRPKNGCTAAILDKFLKGEIDSEQVTAIFLIYHLYMKAYKLRERTSTSISKLNAALTAATSFEKDYFKTENVWSSLVLAVKPIGGGTAKTRECFYLMSKAIDEWKSGGDAKISTSLGINYKASINKYCEERFDISKYSTEYEIVEEVLGKCHVSKIVA